MRILFYAHSSTMYGANTSLINLISGLKLHDKTLELHLIIPVESDLTVILKKYNIHYTILNHYSWIFDNDIYNARLKKNKIIGRIWKYKNIIQKLFLNNLCLKKHKTFAKEFKPDLIYVNSSLAPMGLMVANNLSIPYIWHHRETLNDPITSYYLEDLTRFKYYYKNAKTHIFPSDFLAIYYSALFNDKNTEKKVVPNGVAFLSDTYSQPIRLNKTLRFGMVGRINKQKGQKEVIEAFQQFLNKYRNRIDLPELNLIGGGMKEYIDKLKNTISSNLIFFSGFVNYPETFSGVDYLIINAKNESFGRVVAEANALGIPVIALKSGALPELIKEDINGYLFRDITELIEIIEKLSFQHDEATYNNLTYSSRITFENSFSIEKYSTTIFEEINKFKN